MVNFDHTHLVQRTRIINDLFVSKLYSVYCYIIKSDDRDHNKMFSRCAKTRIIIECKHLKIM